MKTRRIRHQVEHLVGRCLDITDPRISNSWGTHTLTVVSYNADRDHLSIHLGNGIIDTHVERKAFWKAYVNGIFQESRYHAPFVNERRPS